MTWVGMPEGGDALAPQGTWLGFDYGLGRIGVAVGQTTTDTATPLATIGHGQTPDWGAIAQLVKAWRPAGFVVGLPLDSEGGDTEMSRLAREFGGELERRFGLPVNYCDERLTSRAAEARFAQMRASGGARRKDSARLDALAASIILENWLQSRPDRR